MPANILQNTIARYPQLVSLKQIIEEAFNVLVATFGNEGQLLTCGNGGSASDASHIVGELLKNFCLKRHVGDDFRRAAGNEIADNLQGALPAISLPDMVGINTAYANDCNPYYTFAQLVYALGRPQDAILCISTSGNAKNVNLAAKVARAKGMRTIGLTGATGGQLKNNVDVCICAPETETFKIQELHLPIYHTICLMLEKHFFG